MDAPLHRERRRQGLSTALHGSHLHSAPDGVGLRQIGAVLLDIEGTTTPIDFVHQTLFAYARSRVADFLGRHWNDPEVRADVARLRADHTAEAKEPAPPPWRDEVGGVVSYVHWLMERDRKSTGLKSLQGKIWEEGYRSGELRSEVYPDVPPALERWQSQAIDVAIFSSGSVQAQRSLFRNTAAGDLTRFICAYFDTTTGSKKESQSYARIAEALRCSPSEVRFISDVVAELDAARKAGMLTAWCVRDGSVASSGVHPVIQNFDRLPMRNSPVPTEVAPTRPIPPEMEAAVSAWMRSHGWQVTPPRWQRQPEMGFCVWQEEAPAMGRSHGLWIDEAMVRRLGADQLVQVLDREGVAEEIRINYKVRIEERGAEYRVSVVPRRSGEFRRME